MDQTHLKLHYWSETIRKKIYNRTTDWGNFQEFYRNDLGGGGSKTVGNASRKQLSRFIRQAHYTYSALQPIKFSHQVTTHIPVYSSLQGICETRIFQERAKVTPEVTTDSVMGEDVLSTPVSMYTEMKRRNMVQKMSSRH